MHAVVMGVSSCGKSTVGALLAHELGVPFKDGDELHPASNISKMSSGVPLTDEDRWPWLGLIGQWLAEHHEGGVIACSALKRSYRDRIREAAPDTVFIHLHGSKELMAKRMAARPGHFMPESLLNSQFETLEPLSHEERGRVFDVADPPIQIAHDAASWLESSTKE
ncbi:gluconate kinase [Corynebacterium poyangense]|uniref:Gluconokinase n=1 Tax=Corynebacterium poyangense TaxID=2684405 RepID=A0A7H0SQR1_9CORY|nr:gluconokinase [Corynebacterium poyangense]QNQ90886.1 gluconate kinase [Corynebacterium poyangense]